MKNISEMTEQEIIALSDEDVQKMIKLRMMEEGIKLLDKPKVPELFEIEPADTQYFSIPLLDGFAFTDIEEATKVAEILKSAKSLRKVDYDWNRLGSEYKYLKRVNDTSSTGTQILIFFQAGLTPMNYMLRFQILPHRTR